MDFFVEDLNNMINFLILEINEKLFLFLRKEFEENHSCLALFI